MIGKLIAPVKTGYLRFIAKPFVAIPIFIGIYLIANGGAHFPNWNTSHRDLIIVYMVMVLAFITMSNKDVIKEAMRPIVFSATSFVGLFAFTIIIMNLLVQSGTIVPGEFDKSLLIQTVVVQICVIATAEELMFRGVLLSYLGWFLSSVAFAFWHSYAYQVVWYDMSLTGVEVIIPLTIAFLMGVLLVVVARNKSIGIPGAIGIHAGFNLVVVGALVL